LAKVRDAIRMATWTRSMRRFLLKNGAASPSRPCAGKYGKTSKPPRFTNLGQEPTYLTSHRGPSPGVRPANNPASPQARVPLGLPRRRRLPSRPCRQPRPGCPGEPPCPSFREISRYHTHRAFTVDTPPRLLPSWLCVVLRITLTGIDFKTALVFLVLYTGRWSKGQCKRNRVRRCWMLAPRRYSDALNLHKPACELWEGSALHALCKITPDLTMIGVCWQRIEANLQVYSS
jgi:hypothetical protein